jgi:hypothetical protein
MNETIGTQSGAKASNKAGAELTSWVRIVFPFVWVRCADMAAPHTAP